MYSLLKWDFKGAVLPQFSGHHALHTVTFLLLTSGHCWSNDLAAMKAEGERKERAYPESASLPVTTSGQENC